MALPFAGYLLTENEKQQLLEEILTKTDKSGHCLLWSKSVNGRGYPQFRLSKQFRRFGNKVMNPAAVLFAVIYNTYLPNDKNMGLSHLCHNKRCMDCWRHIVYENKSINNQRNTCKRLGNCCNHPNEIRCILLTALRLVKN